jgi:hypothetical protein
MGMNCRAHAKAVPGSLGDGADRRHHAFPRPGVEPRRAIGMAGGEIALVMTPVHDGQVRRGVTLTRVRRRLQQCRNEIANLIGLTQQVLPVGRRDQIVENGACDNR